MILLDTNVVSDSMSARPSETVRRWYGQFAPAEFWVSAVTKAELLYGIECLPDGKRKERLATQIDTFFGSVLKTDVLAFEVQDAAHFASIGAHRRKLGRPISQFDNQIAAIARRRGMTIATRNVRDFEHCGVELVNPWEHP